jgi:methylated-DNA-[protein]-cysteine S-methyltransferase
MAAIRCALFQTAIGACAIAWSDRGVRGVQLPEALESETRARILRQFPGARIGAPSPEVAAAIDGIVELLGGVPNDLREIVLDMQAVPAFDRRVYEIARTIAPGRTMTYGDIAARLSDRAAARAVGSALGRNPFAIVVPCHRVLAADGRPGGFSANGGVVTKLKLLTIEGAQARGTSSLF